MYYTNFKPMNVKLWSHILFALLISIGIIFFILPTYILNGTLLLNNSELLNDSLLNDSLLNDSLLNDSLLNDSLLNDSLLNDSLLNDSLLNDSLLNDSLLNDSLLNDSLLNDSLLNDSLLNDSLLNDSLLNDSLLNDSIPVHKKIKEEYNKIKENNDLDIILISSEQKDESLEIIFYHTSKDLQPISIIGDVKYILSKDNVKQNVNVTLTISDWENKYFRLIVGLDGEALEFGQRKKFDISSSIKDSKGNSVNATIKVIDKLLKKTMANEKVKLGKPNSFDFSIDEGKYDLEIDVKESPVTKIKVNDAIIFDDVDELINIDDVPETGEYSKYEEIYAIDPEGLNFTNATVTATAKGTELFKCADWDFETQICKGTWVKIMNLNPGEEYSFMITPDDPGYAEGCSIWDYRMNFTIDSSKVDETLFNFPVLVMLDSSNYNFSRAQSDGADIRFFDNSNNLLSYEIEDWDNSSEEAYVWVKLTSISSSNDTKFYMIFGNDIVSTAEDSASVWSNNYVAVWHLSESGTGMRYDSTLNYNANPVNYNGDEAITGVIAGADDFDGSNDHLTTSLYINQSSGSGGYTYMAYAKSDITTTSNRLPIFSTDNGGFDWGLIMTRSSDSVPNSYGLFVGDQSVGSGIMDTNYHHLVGLFDKDSGRGKLYIDNSLSVNQPIDYDDSSEDLSIGGNFNYDEYWNGMIDEARISNVVRSTAWIKTDYYSVTNNLLSYGDESVEETLIEYNLTIWDDSETTTIYINENLTFYANYSYSNGSIIYGTCQIRFDTGLGYGSYNSMSLDTNYQYENHFSSAGDYEYEITCNGTGFETLTTNDSFSINSSISMVSLFSSTLNNITTDDLMINYTSLKNVTTDWRLNDVSICSLNLPFNMDNLNVKDYSTNENNGTVIGGTTFVTNGIVGNAYHFDGINSYIDIPDDIIPATTDFTITLWFNSEDVTKYQHIIQSYAAVDGRLTLNIAASEIYVFMGQSSGNILISEPIENDQWYFLVLKREGSTMSLFINNTLIGTGTISTPISRSDQAIGNSPDDSSFDDRNFQGLIDEIKVFDYPLSEEQVGQLYLAGLNNTDLELIVSNETNIGDEWSVLLTPYNEVEGLSVLSDKLTIVDTLPLTSITYPLNTAYLDVTSLQYSFSDPQGLGTIDSCWYSLDEGLTNHTTTCDGDITGLISSPGLNIWTIWINDTDDNLVSDSVSFTIYSRETITECRDLNQTEHVYVLGNNVSTLSDCYNVITDGVILDCNGYSINGDDSGTNDYAVYANNYDNLTVMNCIINDFDGAGIYSERALYHNFNNNTLANNRYGIYLYQNPDTSNEGDHSMYAQINNNIISESEIGIYLTGGRHKRQMNHNITNNLIYNNEEGLKLYSNGYLSYIYYNNFINNTIYNNSQNGIIADGGRNVYYIRANTFTNNRVYDNAQNGMYLESIRYNLFEGNIIYNNSLKGIYLTAEADSNILKENVIFGNGAEGTRLDDDSDDNLFISNHICNNGGYDLYDVNVNNYYKMMCDDTYITSGDCEYSCSDNLIDSCQVITSSGRYYLTQDLVSNGDCLSINGDDVELITNSYTITGDGTGIGLEVNGDNFNVNKLIINNYTTGVEVNGDNSSFSAIQIGDSINGMVLSSGSTGNNVLGLKSCDNTLDINEQGTNNFNSIFCELSSGMSCDDDCDINILDSCQDITESGEYYLFGDIFKYDNCMELNSNVTLNCLGNKILGSSMSLSDNYGIKIIDSDYTNIYNCFIGGYGLYSTTSSSAGVKYQNAMNNKLINSTFVYTSTGISLDAFAGSDWDHVNGNLIENNEFYHDDVAIQLKSGYKKRVELNNLTNNYIENCGFGIKIIANSFEGHVRNNQIINNVIGYSTKDAIQLDTITSILTTGWLIINNSIINGIESGMSIENLDSATIENNIIYNNTMYGIELFGGSDGNILLNNNIDGNGYDGIYLSSDSNSNSLTNDYICDNNRSVGYHDIDDDDSNSFTNITCDYIEGGTVLCANECHPPLSTHVTYVNVTPQPAGPRNNITCNAIGTSTTTSTVNLTFKWYVNSIYNSGFDSVVSCSNDTECSSLILASNIGSGEEWECRVTAYDGIDISEEVSYGVTIQNDAALSFMINEPSTDITVYNENIFNINTTVQCVNVNCGDVQITLDPINDWRYNRKINVTNPNNEILNNYQTKLIIDSIDLHNLTSCDDLLFTNEDRTINYSHWVQSCDSNVIVWIKIDSLLANDSMIINMFYDNNLISNTSNGTLTFRDYGENAESIGLINDHINSNGYVIEMLPDPSVITIEGPEVQFIKTGTAGESYVLDYYGWNDNFRRFINGGSIVNSPYLYPVDIPLIWKVTIAPNNTAKFELNGTTIFDWWSLPYSHGFVAVGGWHTNDLGTYDWVFVREYAEEEPIVTLGVEYSNKNGDVPEGEGSPFYTTVNPYDKSDIACLGNMNVGDSCNLTWDVNVNGANYGIYDFFIYGDGLDIEYQESEHFYVTVETNAPNITIPLITSLVYNNESINCSVIVTDIDNDTLSVSYKWYENGIHNETFDVILNNILSGTTVTTNTPVTGMEVGTNWSCSALVSDGHKNSGWYNSSNVSVKGYATIDIINMPDIIRGGNIINEDTKLYVPDIETIVARVRDINYNNTLNATCNFHINDISIGTNVTNSSGYCIYTFNKNDYSLGPLNISVSGTNLTLSYDLFSNGTLNLEMVRYITILDENNYRSGSAYHYQVGDATVMNINITKNDILEDVDNITVKVYSSDSLIPFATEIYPSGDIERISEGYYESVTIIPVGFDPINEVYLEVYVDDLLQKASSATHSDISIEPSDTVLNLSAIDKEINYIENTTIGIYDEAGYLLENTIIDSMLSRGVGFNSSYSVNLGVPSGIVLDINDLYINNDSIQIEPQFINEVNDSLPLDIKTIVNSVGIEDNFSFSTANITLPKSSVEYDSILHCENWNSNLARCNGEWELTNLTDYVSHGENDTHVWFIVDEFSAYAGGIGYNSTLNIWDDNDPEGGNIICNTNDEVTFFANYTNLSGDLINDSICVIEFNDSVSDILSHSEFYEYTRSFNVTGTYSWNINCSNPGYDNLTNFDNIIITEESITGSGNDNDDHDGERFECRFDSNCGSNELCNREGQCQPIECDVCQHVLNHQCIDYECCDDLDCLETQECLVHECRLISENNNTQEFIDDNQSVVDDNQSDIGDNQSDIGDNQSDIGDNQSVVGDNQSVVGDNQSDVVGNQSLGYIIEGNDINVVEVGVIINIKDLNFVNKRVIITSPSGYQFIISANENGEFDFVSTEIGTYTFEVKGLNIEFNKTEFENDEIVNNGYWLILLSVIIILVIFIPIVYVIILKLGGMAKIINN